MRAEKFSCSFVPDFDTPLTKYNDFNITRILSKLILQRDLVFSGVSSFGNRNM